MPIAFCAYDESAFSSLQKDELIVIARYAETAERYEDMCKFMKARVTRFPDSKLTQQERNLLSVAYKNVIGSRRASWRNCVPGELDQELNDMFKKTVETELETISEDVLDLLKDHLIDFEFDYEKVSESDRKDAAEAQVFYLKMAGDYYRYLTESVYKAADDNGPAYKPEYKDNTKKFYQDALEIAEKHLPETHPIRLGLALNYSVCYYEILDEQEEACKLAKKAFDTAISKLDKLDESDYKDSTLIMQLLRDNLTLWTSDQAEPEDTELQ